MFALLPFGSASALSSTSFPAAAAAAAAAAAGSRFLQTSSNKLAAHDPGRAGPGRRRTAHRHTAGEELVKGAEREYDSGRKLKACCSRGLRLSIYLFIFRIIMKRHITC